MKKRLLSLVLTLCMILSLLPTQVFAAGGNRGRESAIAALAEEYGDQAEAVFTAMVDMGLLDENGNQLTYEVVMDGASYTLEEMRPFFAAQDVDLAKTVTVDGDSVTLEFIKKLLDYQDEMAYLDDFFARQEERLTDEQQNSLMGMTAQFAAEGMSLNTLAEPTQAVLTCKVEEPIYSEAKKQYTYNVVVTMNGPAHGWASFYHSSSAPTEVTRPKSEEITLKMDGATPATIKIPYVVQSGTSGVIVCRLSNAKDAVFIDANGNPSSELNQIIEIDDPQYAEEKSMLEGRNKAPQTQLAHAQWTKKLIVTTDETQKDILVRRDGMFKKFGDGDDPEIHIYGDDTEHNGRFMMPADKPLLRIFKTTLKFPVSDYKYVDQVVIKPLVITVASGSNPSEEDVRAWKESITVFGVRAVLRPYEHGWPDDGRFVPGIANLVSQNPEKAGYLTTMPEFVPDEMTKLSPKLVEHASNTDCGKAVGTEAITIKVADLLPDENTIKQNDTYLQVYVEYSKIRPVQPVLDFTESGGLEYYYLDTVAPAIKSVTVADAPTQPGDTAYVTIVYNDVVEGGSVMIAARSCPAVGKLKVGNVHTYAYKLPKESRFRPLAVSGFDVTNPANDLAFATFSGGKWHGNQAVWSTATHNKSIEVGILPELSIKDIVFKDAAGKAITSTFGGDLTVEIPLFNDNNEDHFDAQNGWLTSKAKEENGKFYVDEVFKLQLDGVTDPVRLELVNEGEKLVGHFTLPTNYSTSSTIKTRFSIVERADTWPRQLGAEYVKSLTHAPVVLVKAEDITITEPAAYPSGTARQLNLGEETGVTLGYTVAGSGTYKGEKDFSWKSSNEDILSVDPTTGGLTPLAIGKATISLVATNGAPEDTEKHVVKELGEFTIWAGGKSAIAVFAQKVSTGAALKLMFSTNIIANGKAYNELQGITPPDFLTKAHVVITSVKGAAKIFEADVAQDNDTFILVPADLLTDCSVGFAPSYTVEVTMVDVNGETITGKGGIVVKSPPAIVALARPKSYFMLSTETGLDVTWTTKNALTGTEGSNETVVTVAKNDALPESVTTNGYHQAFTTPSGVRDTYTVSAKTKNSEDTAWSTDSYVFYVYDPKVLDIFANGASADKFTLENGALAGKSQQEILDLKRKIDLMGSLSTNYTEKAYGVVSDQMYWKSKDSSVASLNLSPTGTPHNIEDYDERYTAGEGDDKKTTVVYRSFSPNLDFVLAGLKDGTVDITARHKLLTDITDSVAVEVKTQKDKLYLLQVQPKATTTATYINGENKTKTITSDASGGFAIYEAKGIKSDITFQSEITDAAVADPGTYVGTYYKRDLTSGERDGSKGELYPLNTMTLRKQAEVKLYFQAPVFEGYQNNGAEVKPFVGSVTLRGGVFKNGKFCPESKIPGTTGGTEGKTYNLTVGDKGMLTLQFDATNFWVTDKDEGLSPNATLEYVFEAKFAATGETAEQGTKYYPAILRFSGNYSTEEAMRMGDNATVLRPTPKDAQGAVMEGNKPFIDTVKLDRFEVGAPAADITQFRGNVGISYHAPRVELCTTALWWGRENASETAWKKLKLNTVYDRSRTLPNLTATTFKYPFSTIPISETRATLTEDNMWLKKSTEKSSLTNLLYGEGGQQERSFNAPFVVRNMMDKGDVVKSPEINDDFKEEIIHSLFAQATVDQKDKLIEKAFQFASKIQFDSADGAFTMLVAPTKDPAVFDALLQLRVGQDLDNAMAADDADGFSGVISTEKGMAQFSAAEAAQHAKEVTKSVVQSITGEGDAPEFLYQVGGLVKVKITYDFSLEKWSVQPVGGGIDAGVGIKFGISIPIELSPIPIQVGFVDINMGASVAVSYRMNMITSPKSVTYTNGFVHESIARPGTSKTVDYEWANKQADYQVDHLTNLKINAFVEVFGGLGFDYTIISLKLGPFGRVGIQNENIFLNRNYLGKTATGVDIANAPAGYKNQTEKAMNGTGLALTATVGIKFEASVIGIKFSKVLASITYTKAWNFRNWAKIREYWFQTTGELLPEYTGSSTEVNIVGKSTKFRMASAAYAAYTGETAIYDGGAHLESYDYLTKYARVWNAATERTSLGRSLDVDGDGKAIAIQTNAYPYANPQVADDGTFFVYLDDGAKASTPEVLPAPADTRAFFSLHGTNGYAQGTAIDAGETVKSYGDSSLTVDGTGTFAAAAWMRQTMEPPVTKAGESVTPTQQGEMLSSTDIMAAVYQSGAWATTRLTENATPDLTPVIAVNGTQAIAVWRSTMIPDPENPMVFGENDMIEYRIYDGTNWGDKKVLYDAASGGSVVGLSAAMMDDGTAAVAYAVNPITDPAPQGGRQEVVCVVLGANDAMTSTQVTNNQVRDENPQLEVVNFGTAEAADWRFVLGWNHAGEKLGDVQLAVFDSAGRLKDDLGNSISELSGGTNVPSLFRFAGMAGDKRTLDNLTVIWSEAGTNGDLIGSDKLRAVQFVVEGEGETRKVYTSAPMPLADLPEHAGNQIHTIADSFAAYVDPTVSHTVKALIMATEYDGKNLENIVTAPGDGVLVDDEDQSPGEEGDTTIPVPAQKSFMYSAKQSFVNAAELTSVVIDPSEVKRGLDLPVTVTIRNNGMNPITHAQVIVGETTHEVVDLNIYPGLSKTITVLQPMGASINDLDYGGTVTFGTDGSKHLTGNGTLRLAVPDVGISKAEVAQAQDGKRNVLVSLCNTSAYGLAGSGKTVKVGLYSSTTHEKAYEQAVLTIADDDLVLLDAGAYTTVLSFDLKTFLGTTAVEGEQVQNEIPVGGLPFFLKVWTEEGTGDTAREIAEYFPDDNESSVLFESPSARNNGKSVAIEVTQGVAQTRAAAGTTTADLTLSSTMMAKQENGNALVNLLDESGKVIESQLLSEEPIVLESEQVVRKSFAFNRLGTSVEAAYFNATPAVQGEAELALLDISGHDIGFHKDTDTYEIVTGKTETGVQLTAVATSKTAVVAVTGNPAQSVDGKLSCQLPATGKVELTVTNGTENGIEKKTYTLNITQESSGSASTDNKVTVTATAGEGGTITPAGKALVDYGGRRTFTITPDEGYTIADVTVNGVSVGAVASYRLLEVQRDTTVAATFQKSSVWENPFLDVAAGDWFFPAVQFMSEQGMMNGVGGGNFGPKGTTTRAMAMTMLYRMAGSPAVKTDERTWYAQGRAWAMEIGLSDGTNPDGGLTREQLVTLLYRHAKGTPPAGEQFAAYSDREKISAFAKEAMAWAIALGIIEGSEGMLNPLNTASRAEVATIFQRFCGITKK